MVAFVPIIMVLGRIAVKVGSKTVKDYLKKNGFRIAKNYKKYKARKKSYYARHDAQGKTTSKLSAKYWSHKVKW